MDSASADAGGENPFAYNCALCPYSTPMGQSYKRHLITHSKSVSILSDPSNQFKCPEPGCQFTTKSQRSWPFFPSHSGSDSVSSCSSAPQEKTHSHLTIRPLAKVFSCSHPNCQCSSHRKDRHIQHTRRHTGEKPYKCRFESCAFASASWGNLVVLFRTHTREKPYKCPVQNCEFSCSQKDSLKKHQVTHKPGEGEEERPSFPCPIQLCICSGKSKCLLVSHMKKHSLEKPFKCSFESCEYRGKFKNHLTLHSKSHSEERLYKCGLCPYRGKTREVVVGHIKRVHSDLRPFKCPEPECGYAAKNKRALNVHSVNHKGKGNKKYAFKPSRATTEYNVNQHQQKVHVKEKKKISKRQLFGSEKPKCKSKSKPQTESKSTDCIGLKGGQTGIFSIAKPASVKIFQRPQIKTKYHDI